MCCNACGRCGVGVMISCLMYSRLTCLSQCCVTFAKGCRINGKDPGENRAEL